VAHAAKKGGDALDVQLSWPFGLLAVELACVLLHARTPLAITSVLLVILQTPQDNWLLARLSESGIFARYKDAKFFLNALTVWTFGTFLASCFLLSKA